MAISGEAELQLVEDDIINVSMSPCPLSRILTLLSKGDGQFKCSQM
jgi:hypothetical protein